MSAIDLQRSASLAGIQSSILVKSDWVDSERFGPIAINLQRFVSSTKKYTNNTPNADLHWNHLGFRLGRVLLGGGGDLLFLWNELVVGCIGGMGATYLYFQLRLGTEEDQVQITYPMDMRHTLLTSAGSFLQASSNAFSPPTWSFIQSLHMCGLRVAIR